jgi:hypothetical protein
MSPDPPSKEDGTSTGASGSEVESCDTQIEAPKVCDGVSYLNSASLHF